MSTVLLFSGGLDSYCLAVIARPDVLLNVDMGTDYGQREAAGLVSPTGVPVTRARLDLAAWERGDRIIPGRNLMLTLLAANYGDTIMLAATAGDRVTDKDDTFATLTNALLDHLFEPQWWLPEGRRVRLTLPAKHLTKTRLVARALQAGADPTRLAVETLSCYDGRGECRACKPCVRRWVALTVNGVPLPWRPAPAALTHATERPAEAREARLAVNLWEGRA